jgi:hypothetical protein
MALDLADGSMYVGTIPGAFYALRFDERAPVRAE